MSKRTLISASPKAKRAKIAVNQHRLDQFWGRTPSAQRDKPKDPGDINLGGLGSGNPNDEAFAWSLAKQEGLDVEKLLQLESSMKRSEVIDVDLLDDDVPQAGSSKLLESIPTERKDPVHPDSPFDPAAPSKSAVVMAQVLPGSNVIFDHVYLPLSVDPPSYVPESSVWLPNTAVPYSFLAWTLSSLSQTRSRISILNILTNALRTISRHHSASLLPALYLLSNSLSPPYSPIELGLGPSIITKAIHNVSGMTHVALRRLYNSMGDAGDVAFQAKSSVRTLIPHPPLLISGVYSSLLAIAGAKGQGAAKQKQSIVEKLLVAAKGEEVRYIARTLSQNIRVGAVRTSLLTALARALVMTPPYPVSPQSRFYCAPELIKEVKPLPVGSKKKVEDTARQELNDRFLDAENLIKKVGLDGLSEHLPLTAGIPLLPTLGSPTRSLDEIYNRVGDLPFTAEFKYDGQRAQIHAFKSKSAPISIKIFSRHLEDMTNKYPDVVVLVEEIFVSSPHTESFIIDAEIVAIDPIDGSLRSFQELSNRARKNVKIGDVNVPVCVFAFDMMYVDGEILLERSFRERRTLLRSRFPPFVSDKKGVARLDHVESCESENGRDAIEEFWQAAVESLSEGLMIKVLDSGEVLEESVAKQAHSRRIPLPATYEPDKRTSAWLKLKKDYVTGLGDSLDLVPVGAWHGNGRKAQWWSPILLAVWDPDCGKLVAVCKCMSGFSDKFYQSLNERYPEKSDTCSLYPIWDMECDTGGFKPQVYFRPCEVWEVRGADVTVSPVSVAALGLASENRGLSLRFPRFIKIREDKNISDASTPEFLAKMYYNQPGHGQDHTGVDDGDLVDVGFEETDPEEDRSDIE